MTEYIIRQPDHVDSSLSIEPLIVGEIVRCRDCEYFEPDGEPSEVYPDRHWCDKLTVYMSPDGFCSFGKRKEVDA